MSWETFSVTLFLFLEIEKLFSFCQTTINQFLVKEKEKNQKCQFSKYSQMQLSWYELEWYKFLEGTAAHKRAWDLPFLFHILLSLKINSQNIQFDSNLSACSMECLKVNVFY